MEDGFRKITHGQNAADSFKTAAPTAKRVPPPIPPRKRDSQLSLLSSGRKDSQPRLQPVQQQQEPDTEGTKGDLKGEKERSVDREGSQEKKIPPEGATERIPDPVESVKPQGEKETKEAPARHVSNGDADKEGGQEEQKGPSDVQLPVRQNGSTNSECSGAKIEKAGDRETVNHESESRVARAEEIERDSDDSDSEEEAKPLLKESAEEKAKAEEKSEGGAILVTFNIHLYILEVLHLSILRYPFECEQVWLRL